MLSEPQWIAVAATIVAASFAVLSFLWKLMGSPTPLSAANLRGLAQRVRRVFIRVACIPVDLRAAGDQRRRDRIERQREAREENLRASLRSAIMRLYEMERGMHRYHKSEWRRQQQLCKREAMRIVGYLGYRISRDTISPIVIPTNYSTESIIVHVGRCPRRPRTFKLTICVHPSPTLTKMQFSWPEAFGDSATVLTTPLTEADTTALGWSFPAKWLDWHPPLPGHSTPERMTPDVMQFRQREEQRAAQLPAERL